MTQMQREINGEELLKQFIGEWQIGVAMKKSPEKVVAGCGDMTAVETDAGINSEINTQIEGYEDYYENDFWSANPTSGEVRLFSMNSEGERVDYTGKWKDTSTLELEWHGTFEDQDKQKLILIKLVSKDQIELQEINYTLGKPVLEIDYVFKRKETNAAS